MKDQLTFEPRYPHHPWGGQWEDRFVVSLNGVDYYRPRFAGEDARMELVAVYSEACSDHIFAHYVGNTPHRTSKEFMIPDLIVAYITLSK